MLPKSIFINISETASFIGQNKWDVITPFERLWKKYDPIQYKVCVSELENRINQKKLEINVIEKEKEIFKEQLQTKQITKKIYDTAIKSIETKKSIVEKVLQTIKKQVDSITLSQSQKIDKELGSVISDTISSTTKNTKDKQKITKEAINNLQVDESTKVELLKQTESLINKTHGTLKEDSAITIFEEKYKVKLDVSQAYYKHLVTTYQECNWFVGGKMDGIYLDGNNSYVVEVKNRMKGFFSSLRDYELVQIQLYLLLTDFKNAKLVERYNSKIRVTDIEKDAEMISEVLEYLKIFIVAFSKFIADFDMKVKYIQMGEQDKTKFLNELYLKDIFNARKVNNQKKIIEAQADQDCLLDDLDEF